MIHGITGIRLCKLNLVMRYLRVLLRSVRGGNFLPNAMSIACEKGWGIGEVNIWIFNLSYSLQLMGKIKD
jgi:hypothetical protein